MELKTIGKRVFDMARTVRAFCALGTAVIRGYAMMLVITATGALAGIDKDDIQLVRRLAFQLITTGKDSMEAEAE